MPGNKVRFTKFMLLAGLLGGSISVSSALTKAAQGNDKTVAAQPTATASTASPAGKAAAPKSAVATTSQRGAEFIRKRWGIDNIIVRSTASGSLIRFSYRVVDAEKAALINDKAKPPYLIEEKMGIALQNCRFLRWKK